MTRTALIILLFATACTNPKNADNAPLTLIVKADSIFYFTGTLKEGMHFKRIPADNASMHSMLSVANKEDGPGMTVTIKLADEGGGGAGRVIENGVWLSATATKLGMTVQPGKLDSLEEKVFSSTTVNIRKPEPLQLFLPREENPSEYASHEPDDKTVTLILTRDIVHHYRGQLSAKENARSATYKDVRSAILSYKKSIGNDIIVLIKPSEEAAYQNTVDILDEMTINDIKQYALVDITPEEATLFNLVTPPTSAKPVVNTDTTLPDNFDLIFYFNTKQEVYYRANGEGVDKALRIHPPTSSNIVKVIDEVALKQNKKAEELKVAIKADPKARYQVFKVVMEAFKQRNLFDFKMISNQKQTNKNLDEK